MSATLSAERGLGLHDLQELWDPKRDRSEGVGCDWRECCRWERNAFAGSLKGSKTGAGDLYQHFAARDVFGCGLLEEFSRCS